MGSGCLSETQNKPIPEPTEELRAKWDADRLSSNSRGLDIDERQIERWITRSSRGVERVEPGKSLTPVAAEIWSINERIQELGDAAAIRDAFIGFQRYICE
jgi:hypothetical protein